MMNLPISFNEINEGSIVKFRYWSGSTYGKERYVWVTKVTSSHIYGCDLELMYVNNSDFYRTFTACATGDIKLLIGAVYKDGIAYGTNHPEMISVMLKIMGQAVDIPQSKITVGVTPFSLMLWTTNEQKTSKTVMVNVIDDVISTKVF